MKKTIIILTTTVIILFLILGLSSITIKDTSAKYTNYQELNHYYSSNKLYISSSNLDKTNKYNIINYYNYDSLELQISNSINSSQITNYDIKYQLTCHILGDAANYYQCLFDESDGNTIETTLPANYTCQEEPTYSKEECLNNKYTLSYLENNNLHNFKLIKLSTSASTISTVEAEILLTTTYPFTQTLKGIYVFNINQDEINTINITQTNETSHTCEYTVSNKYSQSKTIQLNFDNTNIIIDETSETYKNKLSETTSINNYIASITISIPSYSKIKIPFYKRTFNQACNNSNITYTVLS